MKKLEVWGTNFLRKNMGLFFPRIFVFCCPFLYYFRSLIPGHPFSLEINNDFIPLYYKYKLYLIDLLAGGHFPLWSPAEGSGYPFYSNPFTQAFYPLNSLLVILYKILGGYSIFDHQVFTILGVSIYALGLYCWLSLLVSNLRAVLFATVLISLSFKLGEVLRFPNAVHAAAWMPWILYGITQAVVKGKHFRAGLIIFVSCSMLLTAGYPYYVYYCLFLIPPYALLLLFSKTRGAIITKKNCPPFFPRRFLSVLILSPAAALLICTPYLFKMLQLMNQTVNRTGFDYNYATFINFDAADTLGSFIFPPAAQAEGWYYFSIFGVLLLMVFTAGFIISKRFCRPEGIFLMVMLAWFALISCITYGKDSYLFDLLWHHVPGFSSLRVWGRLNIILLPILAMLLTRSYQFFESLLSGDGLEEHMRRRAIMGAIVVLAGTAFAIFAVQIWLYQQKHFDNYWLLYFKNVNGREWIFIYYTVISFVLVTPVLILAYKRPFSSSRSLPFLLALFLIVAATDLFSVGSTQWMRNAPHNRGASRNTLRLERIIQKSLQIPRARVYDTITLPRFNVGWIYSWYFHRYLDFDQKVFSYDNAMIGPGGLLHYGIPMGLKSMRDPGGAGSYADFMGLNNGKKIFITQRIDYASIKDFIADAALTETRFVLGREVKYYDGDNLKLVIQNLQPLYVSFIDNWDPDWKASVNGKRTKIEKLFGTFKSVSVGPGKNDITFNYRPFFK